MIFEMIGQHIGVITKTGTNGVREYLMMMNTVVLILMIDDDD